MARAFGGVGVVSTAILSGFLLAAVLPAGLGSAQDVSDELKARMVKEKEERRTCKISLCKAFAKPDQSAGPISCDVTKTWLASSIQKKFLGDRLSWPWGHAQCKAKIDVDSAQIASAMQAGGGTLKLRKHDIVCTLDSKDPKKGTAYTVKLSIEPEVKFVAGKATKVTMGWSNIDAPALAKGAIWSATKLDQAFSVIGNGVAKEINSFLYEKCADDGVTMAGK